MDSGAWEATVHGVAKSRTRLSDFTSLHLYSIVTVPICICINNVGGFPFLYMHSCNYYLDFLVIAVLTSESVQFSHSVVSDSVTPWTAAHQASLYITNSQSSLGLTSIKSVMPSSHLILCHPLLLLPPIPPSIRVFSNESTLCMRWSKYWSFSFSIIPSKQIPGLISFRMDWLDLLAVQGTLKSLLQHHSSKASVL